MSEIKASKVSMRTRNPIRQIVDNLKIEPNPNLEYISLALGDPTTFGNLKLPDSAVDAVQQELHSFKANGYGPSTGLLTAREAIAHYHSNDRRPLSPNDVIITSGCSGALDLCIGVLCDEGKNILIPKPGFSLYETLASSKAVECRFYNLSPEHKWEADLLHLESLIDDNTACIVLNNPSNPCGSVYSTQHLKDFLTVAEKYNLPVIADEIYADMVFAGEKFVPLASLESRVPILSCGGLAKRFLVPGWRIGWICIFDKESRFSQVRAGLSNLSQLIIGANTLIQAAIPKILATKEQFHQETMNQLEKNARACVELLKKIPGIRVVEPQGAMYVMIQILTEEFKDIKDDVEFVEKLTKEQAVLCLPGQCFRCNGAFVRIVFSNPVAVLESAIKRIHTFCLEHQN